MVRWQRALVQGRLEGLEIFQTWPWCFGLISEWMFFTLLSDPRFDNTQTRGSNVNVEEMAWVLGRDTTLTYFGFCGYNVGVTKT